jgi:hypothetical protein
MSRRDLSVKGGTSERCYRTRRGRNDEQRYAILSPYFDGSIKMNGPYPEITNISFLVKLFFKTFISLIKARLLICMADGRTYLWSFYGVRVVHICVFLNSCVALPIVCPSMISCFRCSGPFFGE